MVAKRKVLWLSTQPAPPNVREAAGRQWELSPWAPDAPLDQALASAGVALACPQDRACDPHALSRLLDAVEHAPAVAVVLLPADAEAAWRLLAGRSGKFVCIRSDASSAEIAAKLAAAASLQPAIRDLQAELSAARRLGDADGRRLEELDEEMRLAARLQRDFLPRRLPEVGDIRFGVLYRPLGWVSGDIYDIRRLDETHLGFYVADAVGHGMPAALLTMFIKQALQSKRIAGHTYEIIPPHVSLEQLNAAICEQGLSSCQFCTAVYCVLDVAERTLTYSRAGHPEPLLLHADGSVELLDGPGSLLGVFPDERYASATVPLAPGDRLVLYTDGAEDALAATPGDRDRFRQAVTSLAAAPRDEMLLQLTAWIDERTALPVEDDITIVTADVAAP